MDAGATERAIGGFLPLEPEVRNTERGLIEFWGMTEANTWCFANARSALAHLLRTRGASRLVLPAYICPEMAAAAESGIETVYYPLSDAISPLVEPLDALLRPNDCAVAVDYFGRPPDRDFRDFAAARGDVIWVEDRAQALWPATASWAEWLLYSPRKLFGVEDGGIMLRAVGGVTQAVYSAESVDERAAPRVLRRDDADESENAIWFEAFRGVEARMGVSREPMSAQTRRLLAGVDPAAAVRFRRRNFATLAKILSGYAFFDGPGGDFAPFGFPVRLADAGRVQQALAERRIYAARYWPRLPSDPADFPSEHALARDLLLLPCDQRYGVADMERVARVFLEVAG